MAVDDDGDVIMADAATDPEPAAEAAGDGADAQPEPKADEPPAPAPDELVARAEAAKEEGNGLLKAGDPGAAAAKYTEGVELIEPLLEKTAEDLGEELKNRNVAVYVALRLNAAQACIKQENYVQAVEHTEKVLSVDQDNTKALYRRGLASSQFESEGRLEQARADFARVAQLDPSNREVRQLLQKVKERLRELKQHEKQRLSIAMQGGLYQEQHNKLVKLQEAYEKEVQRRKDASEDEITFEDWQKKEKEKEEERKKEQKAEMEKQQAEARKKKQQEAYEEDATRRREAGEDEISFEEWQKQETERSLRKAADIVRTDEADLDDEEKELLRETKSKGYYHGRLGTVLSDAAPKPQQIDDSALPAAGKPGAAGSEWNQAGTWEEKDTTAWVKERLTAWLALAKFSMPETALSMGAMTVEGKVTKVKSLTGEAQIVIIRKEPRHGYNFEAELSFSLSLTPVAAASGQGDEEGSQNASASESSRTKISGTLALPLLMDTVQPQDLKMDCTWKGDGPPAVLLPAETEQLLERLRESVRTQVVGFQGEYQKRR